MPPPCCARAVEPDVERDDAGSPGRSRTAASTSALPLWIGSALISTPFSIRNVSRPGSTNAGSVVVNVVALRGSAAVSARTARFAAAVAVGRLLSGGGQVTGVCEAALDARALAVDRLDVALGDLLLERGVGHGDRRVRRRETASASSR